MKVIKENSKLIIHFVSYILFFVFAFSYFFWFANYIFFSQEKSSLFLVSANYLINHLNQPGGLLVYLGELQTTFYYYPLVGAILVALEICFTIYLIAKIGEKLNGRSVLFVPFLIGAALFYLQTNYQYQGFNNLGILLQLLLFYITVVLLKDKKEWIAVFIFPLLYLFTGVFSVMYFVLFVTNLLIKRDKGYLGKLAGLVSLGTLFFYVGQKYFFFQTINSLMVYPFSFQDIGMQNKLFFTLVICISVLPVIFLVNPEKISRLKIRKIPLLQLSPFVIIIGLLIFAPSRIDENIKHYFHAEKLFYQKKYNELIEYNSRFPSKNIITNYLNNIALAETGRLNDELFRFPQSPDGGTLFLKWELYGEVLRHGGYFYYSLGMINEAQRWAYEYMVMRGNTPEGLKMLIKTELINSNYKVASKYISILKKTIFYRKSASKFEKMLFNAAAVESNEELGSKKRLKPKKDFFVLSDKPEANLDLILAGDSTNALAVEYKFAWLMLNKDLVEISQNLPLLEKADYKKIPKNIEEAVVACEQLKVATVPKLNTLQINKQTERRFQQYYRIFQQNSSNKQQAQRALGRDFSDTFWYFVFFS